MTGSEPALAGGAARGRAFLLPHESQLRNPRRLKALIAACASRGVAIEAGVAAEAFCVSEGRVRGVETSLGLRSAGLVAVCSGAWSRSLLAPLGVQLPVCPVRGQMVLLSARRPLLRRIVNVASRYLVPRPDGRILIGSTEEDAGFDKRTTASGVEGLLRFALEVAPGLREAAFERRWAGLRPSTADGLPFMGAIPGLQNAFVSAGHFRSGLHMSCAAAVVMAQLMTGQFPEIDLAPLSPDRAAAVL